MASAVKLFIIGFVIVSAAGLVWAYTNGAGTVDLTKEPGHLKRFGSGRPILPVDGTNGFPDSRTFFRDYVSALKPLKMSGAAKNFKAFQQWNDAYFASLKGLDDEEVLIESSKKENRAYPPSFMSLREFVQIYNDTDQYMISSVPKALKTDMVLPCPVQCAPVVDSALVDAIMWFSSGGTRSVVHTDAVENVNCLMRGEKEFVMVDPELYGDKVDLDRPDGFYSDVDVDAVDYTKYPGLAEVEYSLVNITAGDCLYIPYRWIHQVRSYGSNLAVNIWWDHYKTIDLNPSECSTKCDESLTLDKVNFIGFSAALDSEDAMKSHIRTIVRTHSELSSDKFVKVFLDGETDLPDLSQIGDGYRDLIRKTFQLLDFDRDEILTTGELEHLDSEVWQKVRDIWLKLEVLLIAVEKDLAEKISTNNRRFDEKDWYGNIVEEAKDEL